MQLAKLPQIGPLVGFGLVAAAHFTNDAVTSMLPALLPSFAAKFSLKPSELALLVSAFAVSTSLPQPLFGLLADRLGRQRVGAVGLAVSGVLMVGLSLASSVPWLWLALLLGGLGSSALHPAGMGLARATSATNPALAVAVFSSLGMAGGALGPVLAIGVASIWGFEQLAWCAVPVLLVAMLLVRQGARPAPAAVQAVRGSLGRHLLKGPIRWLAVVALLGNLVMLSFASAIPVWLVAERGLAETSPVIGLTLATFSFAAAVGGILGGVLTRWQSADKLIVGSLAASALVLEAILLVPPGSATYFAAVAGGGALLGLHGPLLISRAQELNPGAASALAGVLLGATSGVAGLIYAGLGAAQSVFGIGPTLAAISLLALPAAHVAAMTFRPRVPRLVLACAASCIAAAAAGQSWRESRPGLADQLSVTDFGPLPPATGNPWHLRRPSPKPGRRDETDAKSPCTGFRGALRRAHANDSRLR